MSIDPGSWEHELPEGRAVGSSPCCSPSLLGPTELGTNRTRHGLAAEVGGESIFCGGVFLTTPSCMMGPVSHFPPGLSRLCFGVKLPGTHSSPQSNVSPQSGPSLSDQVEVWAEKQL